MNLFTWNAFPKCNQKVCMFIAHSMLFRVPVAMLYCEGSSTKPHRHYSYMKNNNDSMWKDRAWWERAFHTHYNGNVRWRMSRGWFDAHAFFFRTTTTFAAYEFDECCSLMQDKQSSTKFIWMSKKSSRFVWHRFFLHVLSKFLFF